MLLHTVFCKDSWEDYNSSFRTNEFISTSVQVVFLIFYDIYSEIFKKNSKFIVSIKDINEYLSIEIEFKQWIMIINYLHD